MSPFTSRTVTGIFTSATRTFSWASTVPAGICWTGWLRLGALGPPEPALRRTSVCTQAEQRTASAPCTSCVCFIPSPARKGPVPAVYLNSTHPHRKTLPQASAIPTMIVCIFRREYPMSARSAKAQAPACAKSPCMKITGFWKAPGPAPAHPGGVPPSTGTAQKRRDRRYHRYVWFRPHRIERNGTGALHAPQKRKYPQACIPGRTNQAP